MRRIPAISSGRSSPAPPHHRSELAGSYTSTAFRPFHKVTYNPGRVSVRVAVNSVDEDSGDSVVDGGPPPTTPDRAGETAPRSSRLAPQRNVAVVVAVGLLI